MEIHSFSLRIFLQIAFIWCFYWGNVNAASSVTYLEPGSYSHVLPEVGKFGYTVTRMNVYCYRGHEKDLSIFLQSITLNIEIESDDFNCFSGFTPKEVEAAHQSHRSIFSFNLLSRSKKRVLKVNPFNQTCIGVETAEEYKVALNLIHLDLTKFSLLAGGLLVFFTAASLSKNNAFYYLSGILLGNCASLLVLIYFVSKLIPRKPLMYGVLASGWTLAAYFAQLVFENIQPILISYQKHVTVYIIAMSCISFAVCYYKGPPKNDRSKNLIKWGLQLVALVSIFFSSEFHEATAGIIVLSLAMYFFPLGILNGVRRFYARKFPPKRRLLSSEEFEEQGRVETEKALLELREFVKSPKCKEQWKLVLNLSKPTRFASFVEGDAHLTLDETREYDQTIDHEMELSDDDTSDVIEESIAVDENFVPISKSELRNFQSSKLRQSISRKTRVTTRVTSSTPNNRTATRFNGSQAKNASFEISDDDE